MRRKTAEQTRNRDCHWILILRWHGANNGTHFLVTSQS